MASGGQKRTRSERVAALEMPLQPWEQLVVNSRRRSRIARMAVALMAALALCVLTRAWDPPFSYRLGWVPPINIVARTAFLREERLPTRDPRDAVDSPILVQFEAGQPIAKAEEPLTRRELRTLRVEYDEVVGSRSWHVRAVRGVAVTAMAWLLLLLCGGYLRYRRNLAITLRQWALLMATTVLTAWVACVASAEGYHAALIPVLLFGMIAAIAFCQEMSLLFCGVLSVMVAIGTGLGFSQFLVLLGVSTAAVLQLNQIRTRVKLIYVGLICGAAAALLDAITAIIDNQPLGATMLSNAGLSGLCAISAGFLMTGLLPFIERFFGVLTDLSLLELGDMAHPLLQELIRRAPATYNHSITVGSIAEAAAESIGARGLLVRVGAYFHDIGKMLKPEYYIENQPTEASMHESLLPAMSTLVIFAHVKDGSDLGRQRHLPRPIIDLIEQHHGTMLVEFFYGRANQQQQQSDPDGAAVDEHTFRYPGPKPQTKEAGVLMLADAVEGASRTLVDPTPARIENLVEEMAEHRLQDGQFDESGLTLRELHSIQRSLVKSLTALYHGRIKYPDQRMA